MDFVLQAWTRTGMRRAAGKRMEHNETRDPRTHEIIGAGLEVYFHMSGFLEPVISDAFAVELRLRHIPFSTEVPFTVTYKGHRLARQYRADFVCYEAVLVEIKANTNRNPELEQAQMLNYLRASGLKHGLLLNFGGPKLTFRRFVADDRWLRVAANESTEGTTG